MNKKTPEVTCTVVTDDDNSIHRIFYKWVEEVEQKSQEGIEIRHYIKTKWYEKIMPNFIYKIFFKPKQIFKNCYPTDIQQ